MRTTPGGNPILDFLPKCKTCGSGEARLVQHVAHRTSGFGMAERPDDVIVTRIECCFCRMMTGEFDGLQGFARAVEAWTGEPPQT